MSATSQRITTLLERVTSPPGRVDRAAGILRGVRVLGRQSKNGREYTLEAMQQALPKYEGAKVCIEHLGRNRATSCVGDTVGVLRNPSFRDGGIVADLFLIRSHPQANYLLDVAESIPSCIGLSHHAEGRTVRRDGREIVEQIYRVKSVDLVADPASTKGLFESVQRPRRRHVPLVHQRWNSAQPVTIRERTNLLAPKTTKHVPLKRMPRN